MSPPSSPSQSASSARTSARRVLVTGGAGFIGSHLVERLLERGDAVTVVDNLSTGRRSNLPEAHVSLRFLEADLGDALGALGKGEVFDEIYHLAAAVGVKLVMNEPIKSIETNIDQTSALLRFAANRRTPTLIASSSEVYGKAAKSPFSEDDDAVYGPTIIGRWSYACSKAIDEYLALAYHAKHGLPTVVARFFNTVGPRQVGDYGMVLPRFVSAAIKNEPLTIYADGSATRCFCDVRDVVEVLPRMLGCSACHGRVFNVGSDVPVSILTLADHVIRTTGSRSTKKFIPYAEAYPAGFEDLQQRQPDLRRLREALSEGGGAGGFRPRIGLEQTIRDVAAQISGGAVTRGAGA